MLVKKRMGWILRLQHGWSERHYRDTPRIPQPANGHRIQRTRHPAVSGRRSSDQRPHLRQQVQGDWPLPVGLWAFHHQDSDQRSKRLLSASNVDMNLPRWYSSGLGTVSWNSTSPKNLVNLSSSNVDMDLPWQCSVGSLGDSILKQLHPHYPSWWIERQCRPGDSILKQIQPQ